MFMLATIDANIWGLLSVPVGVLFCFGPALATWAVLELKSSSGATRKPRNKAPGSN
jgi:hypothetical protein